MCVCVCVSLFRIVPDSIKSFFFPPEEEELFTTTILAYSSLQEKNQ